MSFTQLVFGFVTLMGMSASAWANNVATNYHASLCLEQSETGAFNRSEYRITRTGSTGTGNLFCPVVHHENSQCITGNTAQVTIRVLDNDPTDDIVCTFSSRATAGELMQSATGSTNGSSTTPQQFVLSIAIPPTGIWTYSLICYMPTNSGGWYSKFYGYEVSEGYGC